MHSWFFFEKLQKMNSVFFLSLLIFLLAVSVNFVYAQNVCSLDPVAIDTTSIPLNSVVFDISTNTSQGFLWPRRKVMAEQGHTDKKGWRR